MFFTKDNNRLVDPQHLAIMWHSHRVAHTSISNSSLVTTPSIPSQIISHSKNLGKSKHLKFDKKYRKNYKDLCDQADVL
jgi:hypothetical protein